MTDDWFHRVQETTDRLRLADEIVTPAPNQKPKTVKRNPSYTTPSGASARSVNARSAYHRVQRKQGGGK